MAISDRILRALKPLEVLTAATSDAFSLSTQPELSGRNITMSSIDKIRRRRLIEKHVQKNLNLGCQQCGVRKSNFGLIVCLRQNK